MRGVIFGHQGKTNQRFALQKLIQVYDITGTDPMACSLDGPQVIAASEKDWKSWPSKCRWVGFLPLGWWLLSLFGGVHRHSFRGNMICAVAAGLRRRDAKLLPPSALDFWSQASLQVTGCVWKPTWARRSHQVLAAFLSSSQPFVLPKLAASRPLRLVKAGITDQPVGTNLREMPKLFGKIGVQLFRGALAVRVPGFPCEIETP